MPKTSVTRAFALGLLAVGLAGAGACGGGDDKKPAAVAKFCNPLSLANNQALDLTLEVGAGDRPVALVATSGTCVPAAKTACTGIPVGTNVPVVLKMGSTRLTATVIPEIKAGEEWLVLADLTASNQPVLEDINLANTMLMAKCADLAFGDIFEPGPGPAPMPPTMPTPRM